MRLVFMGTPDFAVATLDALVAAGHEIAAVVTQPDKPKGRGKNVLMTPVKERALFYQIPVYQPKRVREESFLQLLREMELDAIVVAAFGQILSQELLDIPKYGCINVHASLLPKYRGAAPINWVLLNGEKKTGITTMQMDAGLDTGDMLEKAELVIEEKETAGSLHDKLAKLGGELICSTLKKLEEGSLTPTKQEGESCYAKMLEKSLGDIDWTQDAVTIERLVRGLNPWPSAYTHLDGQVLKIWEAEVSERESGEKAGSVFLVEKAAIWVQTGRGSLIIRDLQLQGKKRMDAAAFLRGFALKTGTLLGKGC
ncbi:MAG: methionyl-tRNA formyltransferase [bacterium]|nr:methionyl-tRNA formyltransferase [bacterium]